ncbi:MAG: Holliday junction branch migration protein RuvA [Parachlamydiaceae bacterium]|nr:Holliday junction branch migration protein RuvA [Parachlamydiaceae bacterium]
MFAFFRGILVEASPLHCIIDVRGVGYKLFVPTSALAQLPAIGNEVLVYSSFVVREMSQALYGFLTAQDRDFFEILIGVTGVGPKMALGLIGHLSLRGLQQAIVAGDYIVLCKIPGVGKKTAERLVVEMRDKLKGIAPPDTSPFAIQLPKQQVVADAMSALINLGYNQATAQKALKRSMDSLPEDVDLAVLITTALKNV